MRVGRVIIAGVVGGLVIFAWGVASHTILRLGDMGVRNLPAEQTLLPEMKRSITARGFYPFPGMPEGEMTTQEKDEWIARYKQGPRGVVVFDPSGGDVVSGSQLTGEFLSNVLGALLLAIVLSVGNTGVGTRVVLAGCLGVFAWLSIDVSYWIWYRFPALFAFGELIDQVIGWLLAGVAVALILGRPRVAQTSTNAEGQLFGA